MKPGKVALLRFPLANLVTGNLRPVVLIARVSGPYSDWLVAMVSTNLGQALPGFDEVITRQDYDLVASGLKEANAIKIGRLAVVEAESHSEAHR